MAIIHGNTGNNTLNGTNNADTIDDGHGGNDSLSGNGGNDVIIVTGGTDIANGGANNDTLVVDWSDSTGNTTVGQFYNNGAGSYTNSDGRSVSYSGIENVQFIGGIGEDYFFGGTGNDNLSGGVGNDFLDLFFGTEEFADGGEGIDGLGVGFFNHAAAVSLDLNITSGNQLLAGLGSISSFDFFGFVSGSVFDDIFVTTNLNYNEDLRGRAGDDIIEVRNGDDVVQGESGNDTLVVNWSASTGNTNGNFLSDGSGGYQNSDGRSVNFTTIENLHFIGGTGTDMVIAGAGNDILEGGAGSNTLFGNAGNDRIVVSAGSNSVSGGFDNDTLVVDWSTNVNFSSNTIFITDGSGNLNSGDGRSVGFNTIENVHFIGGSNTDNFYGSTGIDNLSGGRGDDFLDFYLGTDDIADGGEGIDRISGGFQQRLEAVSVDLNITNGNQVVSGVGTLTRFEAFGFIAGTSFDDRFITTNFRLGETIFSGNGNDLIETRNGSDIANGGDGFDTLVINWAASTGNSSVTQTNPDGTGEFSNSDGRTIYYDQIENLHFFGGVGNDTITTRDGEDVLAGGRGTNVLDGGDSFDTASYAGSDVGVLVYLELTGSQNTRYSFDTLLNIENIVGSNFADVLRGNAMANVLTGSDGNDQLSGLDDIDILDGGNGNDILNGGTGGDSMAGGAGNDSYYVDQVDDFLVEEADSGTDKIFSTVSITLGENFEQLQLTSGPINGQGNNLDNVIFGSTGNNILGGGDGADVLRGQGGRDNLFGEAGNDTLDSGSAVDSITGGEGVDRFLFRFLADSDPRRNFADTITDFDQSLDERIQINQIDANTVIGGIQAFEWVGTSAFSNTAGEIRYQQVSGNTFVEADVNGDGISDFTIKLTGLYTLDRTDFIGVVDVFP